MTSDKLAEVAIFVHSLVQMAFAHFNLVLGPQQLTEAVLPEKLFRLMICFIAGVDEKNDVPHRIKRLVMSIGLSEMETGDFQSTYCNP
mgnify:CR=1 FL=1